MLLKWKHLAYTETDKLIKWGPVVVGGCLVTNSCPTLETPWPVAHQTPLSMGFSRQGYLSRLPYPPPGDLPNPGIEFTFLMSPALADWFFTASTIWEAPS